jgi:HEAT repeats
MKARETMRWICLVALMLTATLCSGCQAVRVERCRRRLLTNPPDVETVVQKLVEAGERGVPVLLEATHSEHPATRGAAAGGLLKACWQAPPSAAVVARLGELLDDPDVWVQVLVLDSFIHCVSPGFYRPGQSGGRIAEIRRGTCTALTPLIPEIAKRMGLGRPMRRDAASAMLCLAILGSDDQRVAAALITNLVSDDQEVVGLCASGLKYLHDPAALTPLIPVMVKGITNPNLATRRATATAMARLARLGSEDPRVAASLTANLASEDADVVRICAWGLTLLHAPAAFVPLLDACAALPTDVSADSVVAEALWAQSGGKPEKLFDALHAERSAHRRAAAITLGQIMSRRSACALQSTRYREQTISRLEQRLRVETDPSVRSVLTKAAARIRAAVEADRVSPLR